ncbi:hypothetical protein [Anaerofustis stercorihominis]|uniref:Uncharacterized protein n=1 Tax=Anaerofustis stercorihominis TaxID=214853 RepID=A0A3E3DZA0_9FIRM|nr:hypothetical protein [Anaerofustis stercorihominis]RGD74563.1 hypothetical protein DW687_07345 [Anaerofustis stercorihominis]
MKYELPFLNNIYDSLETVNVDLFCFLELYQGEGYLSHDEIKHIILNLANLLELLIKWRLEQEHWALIFSDINKATYSNYIDGDFISVDIKSGIIRLESICGINCSFSACKKIYQYRNRLMHYTLNSIFEQIIKDLSDAMCEITKFMEGEIIGYLPEEAINDFMKSIYENKKYVNKLKKLEF